MPRTDLGLLWWIWIEHDASLSSDHRIIDGKESVSFLYKVKEMIEDPTKLVFGGKDPGQVLLGL